MKPTLDKKLEHVLAISQKSNILLSYPVFLENKSTKATISMEQLKLVNGGVISKSLYDQRAIKKREKRTPITSNIVKQLEISHTKQWLKG